MVNAHLNLVFWCLVVVVAASSSAKPIGINSDYSVKPSDRACHPFCGDEQDQDWDNRKGLEVNIISDALYHDDGSVVGGVEIGDVVEQRYLEKRSPICKRSPSPCIKKKSKKKLKGKKKKYLAFETFSPITPFRKVGAGVLKKGVYPLIKGSKGVPKLGLKGLAGLTLASAPLVVTVKKAVPKVVKTGPKVAGPLALGPLAGPLALGPLALGAKTLPAGAKVLKTTPLLAPAVLKKGPLAASPLLLPLAGKAAKAKKLAIPAVLLLSQSQGGGSQRSGGRSRSSSGGNRTGGCHGNGSSYSSNSSRGHQNDPCAREGDTNAAEEEIAARAPTEEEKEAALEAQAAMQEAQADINEAKATMQQALAAMRGVQLPAGMQEALAALGRA